MSFIGDKDSLPENWSRHEDSSGNVYFYNSLTQETTSRNPNLKGKSVPRDSKKNPEKRQKVEEAVQPVFKVDLPDSDWILVFTNKGTHFFHNKVTNESQWRVGVESVVRKVEQIERDNLLLLIAKARGLKLSDEQDKELQNGLVPKDNGLEAEEEDLSDNIENSASEVHGDIDIGEIIAEVDAQSESKPDLKPSSTPLISGYSSSEDDSDNEDEGGFEADEKEEVPEATQNVIIEDEASEVENTKPPVGTQPNEIQEEDPAESSEEENAIDLDIIDGISSDEEEQKDPGQSKVIFFQLLQESNLNPFSPWETESLKIINDPRFHEVDTNRDRKTIYDQWSSLAADLLKQKQKDATPVETVDESPLRQYMRFVETKELERLYVDFKKKWKRQLKKLELGDKEREKIYKEYIIFSKKSDADKEKIFRGLLTGAKIFKKNIVESEERDVLNNVVHGDVMEMGDDQAYLLIDELERKLNISESIKNDTKYYIVEVRKRICLILEVGKLVSGV